MRRLINGFAPLALAISVLFNVFFLAGYLQARSGADATVAPPPDRVVAAVSDALALDPGQRATFERLHREMKADDVQLEEAIGVARAAMIEELGAEQPDLERIRGLVRDLAALHRVRRSAGTDRFEEFIGVLQPEQMRRVHDCVSGPGREGRGSMRERLLRRFDRNQDGTLDESERAEAERFLEEMRQRGERIERIVAEVRAEIVARFDADGDGRIGAEERAAIRAAAEQLEAIFDRDGDGAISDEEQYLRRRVLSDGSHRGGREGRDGREGPAPDRGSPPDRRDGRR